MPPETPMVRYEPDENEAVSTAIVTALSRAKGRNITEDESVLYENIDPDALDAMFRQRGTDDPIKVEFTTHEAIVLLWGNGDILIEVQDLEDDPTYGE